jgi:predicted regulator of Ras-like GTPase activity (Roadblock/LC7/MglB family)
MRTPAQADLTRWSDDVARDPRSLAFLPLARAYRRRGLSEEAMKLCLRGLEAHPSHVEAHGLLALLYLDQGDHQRAADEWSVVLRIDPDNFDALRGLGFCYLEQDRLSRARQMLERAAQIRPTEPTVQEALRVLGTRQELSQGGIGRKPALTADEAAWANELPGEGAEMGRANAAGSTPDAAQPLSDEAAEGRAASGFESGTSGHGSWFAHATTSRMELVEEHAAAPPSAPAAPAAGELAQDPECLFDELLGTGPILGALVVDAHGLVMGGRMAGEGGGAAAVLGAVVGGAAGEAARTAGHLGLGDWRGIHIEAEGMLLHLVPLHADGVVVVAARRNTPAGWLRRAAAQAAERAVRFLKVDS